MALKTNPGDTRRGHGRKGEFRRVRATNSADMQRAILSFMATKIAASRVLLEAEIAEQQQNINDIATENERQALARTASGHWGQFQRALADGLNGRSLAQATS